MHGTYRHTRNPKTVDIAKIPNEIVAWNCRRNDGVSPSPYYPTIQRGVGKVVWEWNWPAGPSHARVSRWSKHIIFNRQRKNTTRKKKWCNLRKSLLCCMRRKDVEKRQTIDGGRQQNQLSRQRKHTNIVLTDSEAVSKQCRPIRGSIIHDTRH